MKEVAVKAGVVFPQTEIGTDPVVIRDYAQTVEGLGFDCLMAYDHVVGVKEELRPGWAGVSPYRSHHTFYEPMVLFGYLAGHTSRIQFGTNVLVLPQRQTVLLAKQAAVVDVLTGGRLRLGVGIGYVDAEYEAMGMDFHTRGKRVEEQVELLRRMWTEDAVVFDGKWDNFEGLGISPPPVQRPIPLWMGSMVEVAGRRAARIADGWFATATAPLASHAFDQFRGWVVDAGRDPDDVGIEGLIMVSARLTGGDSRTPADAAADFRTFVDAGATHVSVDTAFAGLETVGAHLEFLNEYADLIGVTDGN